MLKDLFVPYEIAVILKNLGFKKECFTHFQRDGHLTLDPVNTIDDAIATLVQAPIYQQALDFLRTEFKIEITVLESYETPGIFESTIYSELVIDEEDFGTDHTDYYSCLNEAIMEAFNIIHKSKEVAL